MTITSLKIPNDIIMSLNPELNKHEFIMTLILVNGCCHKFYENQTDIYLANTFITENILMTDSIKHYMKKTLDSLNGRKLICDNNKNPAGILFNDIGKLKGRYLIKLNPLFVEIINQQNNYTILNGKLMSKLNMVNLLKMYCLMKRWATIPNYYCYIEWLKWYLNVKHMETKIFFNKYIKPMIKIFNTHEFKIKMTKCKEDERDKKRINKIVFNVFDTTQE